MVMLPTSPHRWLDPLPGLSRDAEHRYWLGTHRFPVSVTGVLATQKSAFAMERIQASKDIWEPRGNTCHRALELAATDTAFHPDYWPPAWPYIDWIEPLLSHPLWDGVQICASEMGLYSLPLDLAGTFDGAFLTRSSPALPWRRILFDLKTQQRPDAGTYDTRPQLGGYLTMALDHGIAFDGAATLWCRPGRTRIAPYGVPECLDGWKAAWDSYQALQARRDRAAALGLALSASAADPFSL